MTKSSSSATAATEPYAPWLDALRPLQLDRFRAFKRINHTAGPPTAVGPLLEQLGRRLTELRQLATDIGVRWGRDDRAVLKPLLGLLAIGAADVANYGVLIHRDFLYQQQQLSKPRRESDDDATD